jgi:hypothetical protein
MRESIQLQTESRLGASDARKEKTHQFTGNIFIFHAFDVGEDINLEAVKDKQLLSRRPLILSKYFKNYHTPLAVELPHPHTSSRSISAKLHNFGVISLAYKIPFSESLEDLRAHINSIEDEFREQSVIDAGSLFKRIKTVIKQPKFFHLRRSYVLIQVDPDPAIDIVTLKETFGSIIASILRFETESLSEYQRNEILESAIGYYRGDLIIVDTEAAFIYDDEYEEILDLFEFANMQQLELQYFDRVLDQQLNVVYEREIRKLPISSYIPFVGALTSDPVSDLGKLKVDISVITERLENSIKLAGEAYYSEIYSLLVEKLDIANWKESIHRKLDIILDVRTVYENKVEALRNDLLSVLIIVLIFIETAVGILAYFK